MRAAAKTWGRRLDLACLGYGSLAVRGEVICEMSQWLTCFTTDDSKTNRKTRSWTSEVVLVVQMTRTLASLLTPDTPRRPRMFSMPILLIHLDFT